DTSHSSGIFIAPFSRSDRKKFQSMRVNKPRIGPNKFELSITKLLVSIVGKAFDQQILARHNLFEIEGNVLSANAPRFGMAGQMQTPPREKKGFRGQPPPKKKKPPTPPPP